MDDKHQVTSKIQRLTFATAGYLKNNEKNKEIDFKRLVWSTTQSMKIDASDVILNPDPTNLLRIFVLCIPDVSTKSGFQLCLNILLIEC